MAQNHPRNRDLDEVGRILKDRCPELHVQHTICDSTRRRQTEISELARQVDMVVVVGGKGSGNTQRLVKVAQAQGSRRFT